METLFPITPKFPEGFQYFPEFITIEEEEQLIAKIAAFEFHTFTFQGYEAKRKVISFGYDYKFENKALTKGKPIPSLFGPLIRKVSKTLLLLPHDFSELLVTFYPAGSVINWHRDAPPFDVIGGISLRSDCRFRLRPQDKAKQTRTAVITMPVKRRSLYVIKGSARTDWQHSISPVKDVRYSITLRTLRKQHK